MIGSEASCRGAAHVLDTAVATFLAGIARDGTGPMAAADIPGTRAALARLQSVPVDAPQISIEDLDIPVGPTGHVGIRILRPAIANGRPLPFVLYLHGGGWIMGDRDTHDRLMRDLADGSGAAVVCVDYTLAPEATYPVQIEQAHAALRYLAAHAADHRLDASRIAVAGDCAGGTMAAAVAMLAKQRRGPEIAFQLMFYPILAELEATDDASAPWLNRATICRYIDAAFPDPASRRLPTAFPLLATFEALNDLPPALVIVAEADPLCGQGEEYARRLVEAGVRATATRHLGTIHDFVALNALADTPAARGAIAEATAALRQALYGP